MNDLISRQDAIDIAMEELDGGTPYDIPGKINGMPSAQPEQRWIPFVVRDLTDEEQKEHPSWCFYLDCELPEPEQEILISSPAWGVYKDVFYNEGEDGCGLDGGENIENGMAWMPLPDPYKEDES